MNTKKKLIKPYKIIRMELCKILMPKSIIISKHGGPEVLELKEIKLDRLDQKKLKSRT